jgi:excisionase family DNA binding protein
MDAPSKGDFGMETAIVEREYVGYGEAEIITGLNRVTIWRAVKAGELKASGSGRGVRFSRGELRRWMESRH